MGSKRENYRKKEGEPKSACERERKKVVKTMKRVKEKTRDQGRNQTSKIEAESAI